MVKAFYVCLIGEPFRWLVDMVPLLFLSYIESVFIPKTHIWGHPLRLFFPFYGIFFLDLHFEERIIIVVLPFTACKSTERRRNKMQFLLFEFVWSFQRIGDR